MACLVTACGWRKRKRSTTRAPARPVGRAPAETQLLSRLARSAESGATPPGHRRSCWPGRPERSNSQKVGSAWPKGRRPLVTPSADQNSPQKPRWPSQSRGARLGPSRSPKGRHRRRWGPAAKLGIGPMRYQPLKTGGWKRGKRCNAELVVQFNSTPEQWSPQERLPGGRG